MLFQSLERLIPTEYPKLEQFWDRFTSLTPQEWKTIKERHGDLFSSVKREILEEAENNAYSTALSILTDKVGVHSAKEMLRELVRQTYVVADMIDNKLENIEQGLSHLIPPPRRVFIHSDYTRILFLPFFVFCELIGNQQSFVKLFDTDCY